jgi:hypothetical protein
MSGGLADCRKPKESIMKKLIGWIVAIISIAAGAEQKVWYCATEAAGGLDWQNGHYKVGEFGPQRFIVKQAESTLMLPQNMDMPSAMCRKAYNGTVFGCTDYSHLFRLNTENGRAVYAVVVGWVNGSNDQESADDMVVSALKCETF